MDWIKTVHWIALFLAFLGPLLGPGAANWVLNLMFILGIIVAIATYNSGVSESGITLLLVAAIALLVLPATMGYRTLVDYLYQVVLFSAWYVMPIALAQGWKALVG